ncbi:MAG: ATP-dependent DNA ligase [Betaproteobacteria bacterium]|nr:MAG: ATP-dependent DNA ligase [Betaproteobacteria bacterium]
MADGLQRYRAMRDFGATPEPPGGAPAARGPRAKARAAEAPRLFVVQRHAARRLHYDFRLEHAGVLLSWAVPKGPSMSAGVRRLAMRTEDHPLDYAWFEGEIPAGQYGAGRVEHWDLGVWTPVGDVADALAGGHLKFDLDGERLSGRFVLIRLKGDGRERGEPWLLIHERGARRAAGGTSGRQPAPQRATGERERARAGLEELPASIAPQLATPVTAPPAGDAWRYEIKFDGYRLLARVAGGRVRLTTRNGLDWTARFPTIAAALARLPVGAAWIDGEAIALDAHGRTSFGALQKALERADHDVLRYAAFDLMFVDGEDLRGAPLVQRQARLAALLADAAPPLVLSQPLEGDAASLVAQACRLRLEGLIAKRADGRYHSRRTRDWLKLKCRPRDEFVVGGFTAPRGSRVGLGALLLGAYDGGKLVYCGRVGTGFDDGTLRALAARLAKLETDAMPFASIPRDQRRLLQHPRWVRPVLVAEVEYAELTPQRLIRQGAFVALRADRSAASVRLPPPAGPIEAPPRAPASRRKRAGRGPKGDAGETTVAGVAITNAQRPLPGHEELTKLDLVRYYEAVAPWLLAQIGRRPLSLVRCPGGDFSQCYFQRHPDGGRGDAQGGAVPFVRVRNVKELVASVQGGTVEFHEWGASLPRIERPDRITLDLDPDPALPWTAFREACELTRVLLDELGLAWFAKTTGGKGLHFVLPVVRREPWDEVKDFAQRIAAHLAATLPSLFVASMSKARRRGRVFVDYLRNGESATAVAAYSLRSRPGLPVAMPIAWEALDEDVRGDHFNLRNVPSLLAARDDPWTGYAAAAQSLAQARRRLG